MNNGYCSEFIYHHEPSKMNTEVIDKHAVIVLACLIWGCG